VWRAVHVSRHITATVCSRVGIEVQTLHGLVDLSGCDTHMEHDGYGRPARAASTSLFKMPSKIQPNAAARSECKNEVKIEARETHSVESKDSQNIPSIRRLESNVQRHALSPPCSVTQAGRLSHAPLDTLASAASAPLFSPPAAVEHAVTPPVVAEGGRKRALLVGINYSRTKGARKLTGCVNDTVWILRLLTERFCFQHEDIWVMTDDAVGLPPGVRHFYPSRMNIVNGMRWLVHGATSTDSLFFQFSGHGSQVPDANGDELDGWDETILPADYTTSGHILDDEIHEVMVRGLCRGAKLTALFDCCNSATIMDLPYVHSPHGGVAGLLNGNAETRIRLRNESTGANDSYGSVMLRVGRKILGHIRNKPSDTEVIRYASQMQKRVADQIKNNGLVISFSACSDHQRSADAFEKTSRSINGAMTYAFVRAMMDADASHSGYNLQSLLNCMRNILDQSGHPQIPHLSLSHDVDLKTPFSL
jgi:hypothetical protein